MALSRRSIAFALLFCVISVTASGCATYETPDGYTLRSEDRQDLVLTILGAPEMVQDQDHYGFGAYRSTVFTYLSRGYTVGFRDGRVGGVAAISSDERPYVARRVRAFREQVSKIRIGDPARRVLAEFGPPDMISTGHMEGRIQFADSTGEYGGQLERAAMAELIQGYWKQRDVYVSLRDGEVIEVRPLVAWEWEHVLGEHAPGEKSP